MEDVLVRLRSQGRGKPASLNYPAVFQLLLAEVGVERIMFSADYPYSSMKEAHGFLDQLPISAVEKEQIAHGNAERLLHL